MSASVGLWLPSRGLEGGSKREAAPDQELRSCATVWIGHNNLDAPPAIQNDGGVLGAKRLLQNASLSFDSPVRRLYTVIEIAINLVDHVTKSMPFFNEKRPLPMERTQMGRRVEHTGEWQVLCEAVGTRFCRLAY